MTDLLYTHTRDEPTSNSISQVFDFADDLPSGVTISSRAIAAVSEVGTDVVATLVTSSSNTTTAITVNISTLTSELSYLITVTANGSDSKTYKQTLLLRVSVPSVFA